MRKFLAAAGLTGALVMMGALTVLAADKGAPAPYAPPAGVVVEEKPFAHGLYLEGSVAAANFKVDNVGTDSFGLFGVGIGYDHVLAKRLVIGARLQYDISRDGDTQALHLGGRLGFLANPHLLLYMPLTYTLDAKDINLNSGIWSVGVGLETALLTNLSLFGEATRNFAVTGGAVDLDEAYFFRAGVRLRF